jgi:hypothetical protein
MKASIPRIRESIKEASMRELNDFLESMRKYSPKIGELAMRHTAEKVNADPTFYGPRTKKQQVGPGFESCDTCIYNMMICSQGCQMVFFKTKNPNLGKFWRAWEWKKFV